MCITINSVKTHKFVNLCDFTEFFKDDNNFFRMSVSKPSSQSVVRSITMTRICVAMWFSPWLKWLPRKLTCLIPLLRDHGGWLPPAASPYLCSKCSSYTTSRCRYRTWWPLPYTGLASICDENSVKSHEFTKLCVIFIIIIIIIITMYY